MKKEEIGHRILTGEFTQKRRCTGSIAIESVPTEVSCRIDGSAQRVLRSWEGFRPVACIVV